MTDIELEITDDSSEIVEIPPAELSRVMSLDQFKGSHFELDIEANEEERQALAKRFGLIELKGLKAHLIFTISTSKSNVHVKGRFEASVVQPCVVTLESVPAEISGEYWCDYAHEISPEDVEIIEFDVTTEDPPEDILDGEFDAGIMLTEQFGLELDPFPRVVGADFDEVRKATNGKLEAADSNNPFAVLKNLK